MLRLVFIFCARPEKRIFPNKSAKIKPTISTRTTNPRINTRLLWRIPGSTSMLARLMTDPWLCGFFSGRLAISSRCSPGCSAWIVWLVS